MNIRTLVAYSYLLASCTTCMQAQNKGLDNTSEYGVLIDTIKAAIYMGPDTDIITYSEENRPGLDGSMRTLDDLIVEREMYHDAKEKGMKSDEESTDKRLKEVQRDNNLTLDQLKGIFKTAGYTFEEGREQFAMMTSVNNILDFKVRSRLTIPEKEVRAYYEENPVRQEATYLLERAVITPPESSSINLDLDILAQLKQNDIELEWGTPFRIKKDEIAEEKQDILVLDVGVISKPYPLEEGFELFRIKEKKDESIASFEERYREISDILRKPRYEKLMEEYIKSLADNASVVYF